MNKSLGFIEGKGFAGIIKATDEMPKTSEVEYYKYENIGGGFNTIIYSGEVGAVHSAVDTSASYVNEVGILHTTNVIPAPHPDLYDFIKKGSEKKYNVTDYGIALGMVETKGFVPMIAAADAGIKAANVLLSNWLTIGGGITTVFFRGDVAEVTSAVEFAETSASKIGEVVSRHIIPSPHLLTNETMPIGKLNDRKSGNTLVKNGGKGEALGVIETKSFIALVEAVDSGIKSSSVISSGWYKVGSSMVSTIFRGDVAAVKTAVSVAARNAERLGELVSSYVIPRPHDFVENIVL